MKRGQSKILNEEVKRPYEWIRRTIEDVYGNEYHYVQISLIGKEGKYWAMNTDNDIEGNWAIKIGGEFIERAKGYKNAIKRLEELNENK